MTVGKSVGRLKIQLDAAHIRKSSGQSHRQFQDFPDADTLLEIIHAVGQVVQVLGDDVRPPDLSRYSVAYNLEALSGSMGMPFSAMRL
jgi:hypothetical protein